jgi:hypothetical protein
VTLCNWRQCCQCASSRLLVNRNVMTLLARHPERGFRRGGFTARGLAGRSHRARSPCGWTELPVKPLRWPGRARPWNVDGLLAWPMGNNQRAPRGTASIGLHVAAVPCPGQL